MRDTAEQPSRFLPEDVCPALMTKTMTLNPDYRRSPDETEVEADTAHFYCLQTVNEHGPDDDDVLPELCRPGRSCYCRGVDPT